MKKILLLIIMLFIFPITVLGVKYEISDFSLTIDIPDSYLVLTVDNYKGNSVLEDLGVSEQYFETFFKSNDCYLDAYNISEGIEIFIAEKKSVGDFRRSTSTQLEKDRDTLNSRIQEQSEEIISSYTEKINEIPFIIIEYKVTGGYVLDYMTIVENKAFTFKFQTTGGPFSASQKNDFLNIMKTVSLDLKPISNSSYWIETVAFLIIIILLTFFRKKNNKEKCPYCKNKIDNETIFCTRCGNRVKKDSEIKEVKE